MKNLKKKVLVLSALIFCINTTINAQSQNFDKICLEKSNTTSSAVKGIDDWFFLKSELRHLSVGAFWGEKSVQTARSTNPSQKDPLTAIVNYNQTLADEQIRLVLVPIPPKAVIYPDKLADGFEVKRYDKNLKQFYSLLKEKGIEVLDLTDSLLEERRKNSEPLYCLGDSHLSGEGCKFVAQSIASYLKMKGKNKYKIQEDIIDMTGDLYKTTSHISEKRKVYRVSGDLLKDASSSIVLMGDSHTLVYDVGGDLFYQDAGIASLLSAQIGMPIDVVGVRGSGATPARINFFRACKKDKEYLKEKKIVLWCFSAREFTEATAWHPNVPVK